MSLIEFNVYVNLFNKITEFDVRNDYSITKVKTYVYKKLNINHTNFIMYFGDVLPKGVQSASKTQ